MPFEDFRLRKEKGSDDHEFWGYEMLSHVEHGPVAYQIRGVLLTGQHVKSISELP